MVGGAEEEAVRQDHLLAVGEKGALFLFGGLEGVGDENDIRAGLIPYEKAYEIGMDVFAVGYYFAA
jgi:hypothetical protein